MNLTKDQLRSIIESSIKDQLTKADGKEKTRMTRSELKSVVREMIESALFEETKDGHNYEEFFRTKMKEMFGTESLDDLTDKQRKEFFSAVDHDWKAQNEKINEGRGACAECGNAYEECECDEEDEDEKNEMCEKCGKKHNSEISECGAGYTKTTVMENEIKKVSSKEFQSIVRQMIIEESLNLKNKFLNEEFHPRGDSKELHEIWPFKKKRHATDWWK